MHACSRIHRKLSFQLYCGCGGQNPLIGRRIECSIFRFFELVDIIGKFPRVCAGASLLSFGLFLRSVLKFHGVGTALMRTFNLVFYSAMDLCFLGVNRTRRIGPKTFVPFLDKDSGGSVSCDTQPNCRTLSKVAAALLSPPFFCLLSGCSPTFQCGVSDFSN